MEYLKIMKKVMQVILAVLLIAIIVGSIGWYLFVYDRDFTRDLLLQQARFNDLHGNARISAWFYDMAYTYSGRDENVAIELANQYKQSGNYTKAEATLTNAIRQSGTVELYTALSRTYAEQNKLHDSVALLNTVQDPEIKAQLDALRPKAPVPDQKAGFYSQYIKVALESDGTIYYCLDNDYPSTDEAPYSEPISLGAGETTILAVSVDKTGLVSDLAELDYTIGGIVEAVEINDPAINAAIREKLQKTETEPLYSNDLWGLKEFTVPEGTQSVQDLQKIPYLKKLTINKFNLPDLNFLEGFTKLETLDLSGCRLPAESLQILASLPSIENLLLSDCGFSTIAPLSQVTSLKKLDLSSNTIRNLEVLAGMPNLEEINLKHNALTDLSALSNLTGLKRLNVSFNSLTSLSPIAGCVNLTYLDAENNQLDSLSGIENMVNLTFLSVNYNKLSDVSLLSGLTQLETLKIANNQISDISSLSSLQKLDSFYFAHNEIEQLPAWPEGSLLRVIDGANNALKSIEPLSVMHELGYVYLDYNELTSVDPIAKCVNLVQVNVYGNEISDVSALTDQDIIVNYDPT